MGPGARRDGLRRPGSAQKPVAQHRRPSESIGIPAPLPVEPLFPPQRESTGGALEFSSFRHHNFRSRGYTGQQLADLRRRQVWNISGIGLPYRPRLCQQTLLPKRPAEKSPIALRDCPDGSGQFLHEGLIQGFPPTPSLPGEPDEGIQVTVPSISPSPSPPSDKPTVPLWWHIMCPDVKHSDGRRRRCDGRAG